MISRNSILGPIVVGAACVAAGAGHAQAQDGGNEDSVVLIGVVRDFQSSHSDFGFAPSSSGHIAGNVSTVLGPDALPFLGDIGFEVGAQWQSRTSAPIAPHMYMIGPGTAVIPVSIPPASYNWSYADTYDADLGAYGGDNVGSEPRYLVGADMPIISEPTDLPAPIGEWKRDQNHKSTVLDTDLDCGKFLVGNHHTVFIDGDVTILCREEFKIQNGAEIRLLEGASLTVYCRGVLTIQDQCSVGLDTADHRRITFYNLGIDPFIIQNQTAVYATVVSPGALLHIQDNSNFYGSFTGHGVHLQNRAGLHIDGTAESVCGYAVADVLGAPALASDGYIDSASTFDTWYRDVPGQNLAIRHGIALEPMGDGFFEYSESQFYPVDGDLYGNEGDAHNRGFTYQVGAEFTFWGCQNQVIELQGTDDVWVYVDDRLVVDLGGIGADQVQVAELDRLNLEDGERYTFTVFYAHRSNTVPSFRIRTNLDLQNDWRVSQIPVFPGYD